VDDEAGIAAMIAWLAADGLPAPLPTAGVISTSQAATVLDANADDASGADSSKNGGSSYSTMATTPCPAIPLVADDHAPANVSATAARVVVSADTIAASGEPANPEVEPGDAQAAVKFRRMMRPLQIDRDFRTGQRVDAPPPCGSAAPPVNAAASENIDSVQRPGDSTQPVGVMPDMARDTNPVAGIPMPAVRAHNLATAGSVAAPLVSTPLESSAWSKDFGRHIIRLAMQGQPSAEIHLNPPELGPIRITIQIHGQEAALQFSAVHLQTREAIEGAIPRLREMFAADSLSLTSASVTGEHLPQHFSRGQEQRPAPAPLADINRHVIAAVEAAPTPAAIRPLASRTRIDLFA